ncbi:MAG TPA: metallopeptidase TldD-related protein [Kofleriaceae bacterium]|jgi:predicted Zn-dependent protease
MIDRGTLAQALRQQPLADWVVLEHDQELHVRDGVSSRGEIRTRWRIVAHVDTPKGRGTARLAIDADDGDPDEVAERAVASALASVGPAWESAPAAAPARVELEDPAFTGELAAIADHLLAALGTPGVQLAPTARLLREHVSVLGNQGFHAEWNATLARVDLLASAAGRSLLVAREARRLDALDLDAAIATAAADLQLLAQATAPVPGECAVVLAADALVPIELGERGQLGVWDAFAAQADAVLAREGLARFHERSPIAEGADHVPEPLTVESDGALAFGLRSAPLGDDGDAVRRFAIVDRGIAAGLGLSPREAALRKRDPNGGVRNLVVPPGTWDGRVDGSGRTIEVRRLRELSIDRFTGDASLEIALAVEHGKGPFAGGTIRLDLVAALARARRSSERMRRGAYDGPSSVWIERAELLA